MYLALIICNFYIRLDSNYLPHIVLYSKRNINCKLLFFDLLIYAEDSCKSMFLTLTHLFLKPYQVDIMIMSTFRWTNWGGEVK